MEEETSFVVVDGVVVPESALLRRERKNPYGSVPDLDDEELADPEELERQAVQQEWGPVLALPRPKRHSDIRPVVDESGGVDWGAFGTVDFERGHPGFDKLRYKADRLREKLQDVLITLSIVKERLPGKAKYLVLKYLRMGIIQPKHVVNEDVLVLARLYRRAEQLRTEIKELAEARQRRHERELARLLA